MAEFGAKRALLRKPDLFRRFLPGPSEFLLSELTVAGESISATLQGDDVVLVFERGGQRRGLLARTTWWTRFMVWLTSRWQGKHPPGFRRTMDRTDERLPEMTMGLGLAEEGGMFLPLSVIPQVENSELETSALLFSWRNRELRVSIDAKSGIPRAYPNCAIHS